MGLGIPVTGMAERTEDRTAGREDVQVDVDAVSDLTLDEDAAATDADTESASDTDSSSESRIAGRLASLFSLQWLAVALVATVLGIFAGGALPFGIVGRLVGVAVAAGVVGAISERQRYLETILAGAAGSGVAALLSWVVLSMLSLGTPAIFGAGAGALVAAIGHYLGRDLRDGLTREV